MALVTSVKKVRKHMDVEIDGERFHVSLPIFQERPLEEGMDVDLEAYRQFLLIRQYPAAMKSAGSLLSAKGYSEKELENTLVRGGYMRETAEMVVLKLHLAGFLNDEAYAEIFVQSHAEAGHGHKRIEQDLKRKGVDQDTIREALDNLDPETMKTMAAALVRRTLSHAHGRPGDTRRRLDDRAIGMLLRRGYSYDEAREALQTVREELDEDMDDEAFSGPTEEEQLESARALVRKQLSRPDSGDPRKTSQRILAMLARRGYPYEIAREALDSVRHEEA